MNRHRLGSLDAVLLLELLRCWPEDGIVEGKLMRLPVRALLGTGASRGAIMLAARRLRRWDLVSLEVFRGRVHYRLWLDFACAMPPGEGSHGVVPLGPGLIGALSPHVSRGRDVAVLLHLFAVAQPGQPIENITVGGLARRPGMMPRSMHRSLARIRNAGAVVRVRRGWNLGPLIAAVARRRTD